VKLIALSLLTAAGIGLHSAVAVPATPAGPAGPDIPDIPAASWAPRDSADTLWRKGRIAISEEAWRDAAWHFRTLVDRFPNSAYAGDALYWQAFALQRSGSGSDLRGAVRALELQRERYAQSATFVSGESSALMTRVNGRLARTGDAEAAVAIAEIATAAAQMGAAVATEVMPLVAEELARVGPEIQREVAQAMREATSEVAREAREASRSARSAAAVQGGRRGRDEVPPGCEGVISEERIEALNALLQMNGDQALPILKRVLERRDRCSEVLRRKAVFLVSQKRSDEAVDILVNAAKTDPDPATREQAVFWLSQTRSERAVEVLEQILLRESASDPELQKRAIFSLSQTRSERAGTILRDYVKRTDVPTESRGEAIFWLGQRRSAENASFLREVFPSLDDDELREKVLFGMGQQRNQESARWLLQQAKNTRLSGDLRKSALFWAGQGGASVSDLAEIYDTSADDRELRNQVIFTLSQRRSDGAAVDKLVDIARKEPDPELRKQALFWLSQTRDPRVPALLEEIINKP
jgi:HEAT repeat protein